MLRLFVLNLNTPENSIKYSIHKVCSFYQLLVDVWQAKVIYVRNLPEGATEEQVMKLFEPHGEISKVVLPPSRPGQPKRDFGFIHYVDRSGAVKAIDKAHKYVLGGNGN